MARRKRAASSGFKSSSSGIAAATWRFLPFSACGAKFPAEFFFLSGKNLRFRARNGFSAKSLSDMRSNRTDCVMVKKAAAMPRLNKNQPRTCYGAFGASAGFCASGVVAGRCCVGAGSWAFAPCAGSGTAGAGTEAAGSSILTLRMVDSLLGRELVT